MTDDVPVVGDLTAHEIRVLGCLIEKEATVPDTYPLTLNSLRTACNQSTSRDPVVAYSDHEIEVALASLRTRGLTRTVHSTSNRATKYRHVLPEALELDAGETAVLSVLMLRGPQTAGELKTRTERQHRFDSAESVAEVLARLAQRSRPLTLQLDRQPGQKDARWVHLLGEVEARTPAAPTAKRSDPYGEATAEFYDLLATDMWEDFGLQLLDLLADVDPTAGPVVDVGSGTGVGLAAIRVAVPGASVFAVEPSKAMRVALHARLHDQPELRSVTTVSPFTFGDATLPARASAIVASAVLGHLSAAERRKLWEYVATSLPVGAPAVIGVLPPDQPLVVEPVRYHSIEVGDYSYEGWQSGVPIDERTMQWTLEYRVVDNHGDPVASYHASAPWRCDSVAGVRAEIASFGLTLTEHGDCVVVRRRVG